VKVDIKVRYKYTIQDKFKPTPIQLGLTMLEELRSSSLAIGVNL
jgi:hypothetical protein